MNLLLFPNNLYENKYLPKNIDTIYLLEDPVYFGERDIKMKFNKLKLMLHRSSMKYYEEYLKDKKYKVKYFDYKEIKTKSYNFLKKLKDICFFELNDHFLKKKLLKYIKNDHKILDNPNFLLKVSDLIEYQESKKIKNKFFHKNFYDFVKGKLDILVKTKSYDMDNRNTIPKGLKIPELPKDKKYKYEEEAKQYVEKLFPKNYGNTDNLIYPITHADSKRWFTDFLKKRFDKYGTYQDAILEENGFTFHSVISPMMNSGLLNPDYIIDEATEYFNKNKKKIGMNNYEGFVRQVIGWREYQRYCYLFAYDDLVSKNIFKHNRKLNSKWYNGTTGIKIIDDCIKFGFKYGYLHHIIRLMVMSNFMNLCNLKPIECYKWFMEFAVDSYDWVMIQNVYSMGQWSDGGLTMRKPYISSDNYILNMSNYQKDEWCKIWKSLYYNFLSSHENELKKTPYIRNLSHWKKMSKKDQDEILKLSKKTIKDLTK